MRIITIITALLFLTACFWGGQQGPAADTWLELVERESFSIFLPINWQQVPESELVNPSQWELVLWYRSIESRSGYFNNIIILRDENRLQETDISLMNNNINTLRLSLQSFDLIAEESLELDGSREGKVIVFRGKYGTQTPEAHYIQTAISCGESSYFLTISIWNDLWDFTRYFPLLESFRCRNEW